MLLYHTNHSSGLKKRMILLNHFPATGMAAFFSVIILLGLPLQIQAASWNSTFPEKIIVVKVDESGAISIGRDTIKSDELAKYLQQRLFKSYAGTGKMYDAIKMVIGGKPQEVITDIVRKEIANGQKRALTELCLEKYKKLFADISSRQQDKLKKNFPVLFQTSYD
jgi:hypothetical protein